MKRLIPLFFGLVLALTAFSGTAFAQEGELDYQEALEAKEAGKYDEALRLLERAYLTEKNLLYIYERALVLEAMGEYDLALQILGEYRKQMLEHEAISDYVVTEERIQQKAAEAPDPDEVEEEEDGPKSGPNTVAILMMGGGFVLFVTSIGLFVGANGKARSLRCSPNSTISDCDTQGRFYSKSEYNRGKRSIFFMRTFGVLAALGAAGVATLGVWRWKNASVAIEPTDGGAAIDFTWRF